MTSELENLDSDWEMTVLPQPKAPGIAVVPPCTHLWFDNVKKRITETTSSRAKIKTVLTERERLAPFVLSTVDSWQQAFLRQASFVSQARSRNKIEIHTQSYKNQPRV